jgi:DNA-binding response OmpR family regulator
VASSSTILVSKTRRRSRPSSPYLRNAGYAVRAASSAKAALVGLRASCRHDRARLNLPDGDGVGSAGSGRARRRSHAHGRDDDVDKILGLEVGADDYLTKPFNPRELVARVKSILRRTAPARRTLESAAMAHGELAIDAGRREATVGGIEVQLAPKEFDLLWELLDHRGIVLTRDQLLERVWGYTFAGDTRTVDVHVRQLRRKLGEACPVVTVWGVGYKVSPEPKPAPA